MINRRDFLKLSGAMVAGGIVSLKSSPTQAMLSGAKILYEGVDLKGWRVELGDSIYPTGDVSLADIKTVHRTDYSELQANVNRRGIMAHNITFNRITDPNALTYIHTCSVSFRLPYLPQKNTSSTLNGQTVESGIFVWNGPNTNPIDCGMAFQWVVNPWGELNMPQGTLRVWNGKNWTRVGKLTVDTNWHTLKMVVDFKRKNTLLLIDNKYQLSRFSKTSKVGWGNTIDARFQVEAVSVDPRPDNIIKAMHRVQFKDWKWLWEPAMC